jgi:hypothetical protein
MDEKLLAPLGYDPTGLDGSGIEASLLQGGYVAVHTYGWTEFDVDQGTQVLTVTTYGIAPYTVADLATNPNDVVTRTPTVVSQFTVNPKRTLAPLVAVTIDGPVTGTISVTHSFTATVRPISATTPITYVWQASDQTPVTQTGQVSDTARFAWPVTGTKTVTVIARNGGPPASNTHTITVTANRIRREKIYLPLILRNE